MMMKELAADHAHARTGVMVIDQQKKIIQASEQAETILGLPASDVTGADARELFPSLAQPINDALSQGRVSLGLVIEVGEAEIKVDVFPLSLEDDQGAVLCVIQRASEDRPDHLPIIEHFFRDILDSFIDGIWVCDHQGTVLWLNRSALDINHLREELVVGKNMARLLDENQVELSVTEQVRQGLERKQLIRQAKGGQQIMVTGYPILHKPGELALIVVTERDFTELNRLRRDLEESRSLAQEYRSEIHQLLTKQAELSDLVVRSPSMHRIVRTALKVAKSNSTVVIQGESGTGKGLLANLIHRNSDMKEGPFIQVDCGAIPETLIESELFGYESGAFTGAKAKGKPGLFELAHEGTLFLDEVGDLPLNMQTRLLRFVESNELLRVGGTRPRKVKVRVLAATHRNLVEMVDEGGFRRDLFFRLNVVPLHLPPLRERLEDVPPIALKILEKFNRIRGSEKRLSPEVLDRLTMYDFPGNVRELVNIMERMIVMSEGDVITIDDVPAQVKITISKRPSDPGVIPPGDFNLKAAVEAFESRIIGGALNNHRTMAAAARSLGVKPSTLCRKIQRLGLQNKIE